MEYNQSRIIECDRMSAPDRNDDNPALWTNQYNDSLQLKAGDKVSVYSAFVSDRGSSELKAVEFKGESFKKKNKIIVTETTEELAFNDKSPTGDMYVKRTIVNNVEREIEMFDNKASIGIQYYKTMDLKNYNQLPRRGFSLSSGGSASYNLPDTIANGRVNLEPYPINLVLTDTFGYILEDFTGLTTDKGDDPVVEPRMPVTSWIQKNNNSRYTIMKMNGLYEMRETTDGIVFESAPAEVDRSLLPQYYEQDPEWFSPVILHEKIDIEIPSGMSSASYVGQEITRQLQESKVEPTRFTYQKAVGDANILKAQASSRTVESNTYKLFTATNDIIWSVGFFELYICDNSATAGGVDTGLAGPVLLSPSPDNPMPGPGGSDPAGTNGLLQIGGNPDTLKQNITRTAIYRNYHNIAIKRPELYEKGCRLNPYLFGNTLDPNLTPAEGIRIANTKTTGLVVNMPYHKDFLLRMKEFVEAQPLYPEMFSNKNIFNLESDAERTYSKKGTSTSDPTQYFINVDKQRYFYMNVKQINGSRGASANDSRCYLQYSDKRNTMRDTASQFFTQLGNSFYSWKGTSDPGTGTVSYNYTTPTLDMKSRPFFFHYDKLQKDTYYDSPADDINWETHPELTYGFIGKKALTHSIDNLPQGTYVELKDITGPNAIYNGKIAQITLKNDVHPTDPTDYLVRPDDPDILTGRGDQGMGFVVTEANVIPLPVCVIYPNRVIGDGGTGIGIPSYFSNDATVLIQGTKIGFDRHYNAWGTCAIILSDGLGPSYYPTEFDDSVQPYNSFTNASAGARPTTTTFTSSSVILSRIYQGADRPTLNFDGQHFTWSFLHTPLNKGALQNAKAVTEQDTAKGDIVYKMNPIQDYDNYTSAQMPYEAGIPFRYKEDTGTGLDNKYFPLNMNVEPYSIYDAPTGIFISNWGFPQDIWDDSMWGRLGFNYNQVNNGDVSSDRQRRMEGKKDTTNILTTNCNVPVLDTKDFAQNQFYVSKVNGQVMRTSLLNIRVDSANPEVTTIVPFFPRIVQKTDSFSLVADDYPLSMFKGYYCIRASIVPDSFTAGSDGDTNLPVIGIVDKMNPKGDFFFGSEQSIQYVITKPTTLSSITIGITDPDGSWATISNRSSIVLRIDRPTTLNTDIVSEVQSTIEKRVKALGIKS